MNIEKMARMLEKAVEKAMKNPHAETEPPHISFGVHFEESECEHMREDFKEEFSHWGNYFAMCKKYDFGYELRYRRHGFNVSVFHKDLAAAKQLFIAEVSA